MLIIHSRKKNRAANKEDGIVRRKGEQTQADEEQDGYPTKIL